MADLRAARRYATAFFGVAVRQNELETAESDLKSLLMVWKNTPQLAEAMTRPQVPLEVKVRIWDQLLQGNVSPLTQRFIHMLVERRRIDLLPAVGDELQRLSDEHRNIVRAHVTTAYPLTPELEEALKARLGQKTGKTVVLIPAVEPQIMGGVLVRLGDRIIDGTVRGYLSRLHHQLAGTH